MANKTKFERGSDVEVAQFITSDLRKKYRGNAVSGEWVVYDDGEIRAFDSIHWKELKPAEIRKQVEAKDGEELKNGTHLCLSNNKVEGIMKCLASQLYQEAFFKNPAEIGIPCRNGFIRFESGEPELVPHSPEHRNRHFIDAEWKPNTGTLREGTFLHTLLNGCFRDDPDRDQKIALLAQVAGVVALGCGTRGPKPKAVILWGPEANNGKGQVLELLRQFVPEDCQAMTPPTQFKDQAYLIGLAGKVLNASDELGTDKAITSDKFKMLVTGDPVEARDLYHSKAKFYPKAQHVFATNDLPSFQGGMANDITRRLLVLKFNRSIPENEEIGEIAMKIVEGELSDLLAWAVEGAKTWLANGKRFIEPESSKEVLDEWANDDPVRQWIKEQLIRTMLRVVNDDGLEDVLGVDAYTNFQDYARAEQLGLAASNLQLKSFFKRLRKYGVCLKRTNKGLALIGMRLKSAPSNRAGDRLLRA